MKHLWWSRSQQGENTEYGCDFEQNFDTKHASIFYQTRWNFKNSEKELRRTAVEIKTGETKRRNEKHVVVGRHSIETIVCSMLAPAEQSDPHIFYVICVVCIRVNSKDFSTCAVQQMRYTTCRVSFEWISTKSVGLLFPIVELWADTFAFKIPS